MTSPLRFGPFELDADAFRLRRDGVAVPIEPKALALLQLLIARAPKVVDKAEIFAEVWKGVAVTDNALTRVVTHLRKALDDDPKKPRYIETVATRGYRWIALSDEAPTIPASAPVEIPDVARTSGNGRSKRRSLWLYGGVAAAVAIVATTLGVLIRSGVSHSRASVRENGASLPDVSTLAALRPAQVSSGSGYDGYLALAPDGRSIAFSSDRTGALEVYVQSIAAGSAVTALTHDSRQNVQPEWSPDGQFIAYHEMAGGGIWVIPSRGGVARKVSDFGSNPAWSPDGRRIAFQSIPVTQVNGFGIPGLLSSIAVVNASGDAPPRVLTTPGIPEGPHLNPSWLDDGHVVFAAGQDGDRVSLWSAGLDGRAPRLFAAHERMGIDYVLSPDHTRALFIARGTNAIWSMPVGTDGPTTTQALPTGLQTVGAFIGGLTMSGDGRRIGWTSIEITGHVWARSGDAPSPRPELTALTQGPGIRYTNPAPASDGRVLMNGNRPGVGFSLYLFDGIGDPRALTPHPPAHVASQWLPGEREAVVFTEHGDAAHPAGPAVFALDSVTGRERRLFGLDELPHPPDSQPSSAAAVAAVTFSRQFERAVVVLVKDGRPNLWMAGLRDMKPDGSLVQKTFERDGASYPAWSPNDQWIAYQCGEGGDTHVCVMDVATGARTQLTHEPGQSWIGGWGADNDTIFLAARRAAVWNIATVSRTTGVVRTLTRYTDATGYVRYPKWDEANKRVLFERSEAVGRTWAVTLPVH